ncbi:MAG: glucoamylase family protein [Bacillota bacterium]|nr:glucoamylase family protein [Bacillota bacterium]
MLYIYIIIIILAAAVIMYLFINKIKQDEGNLLEDFPAVNINKEELEKHAIDISNDNSGYRKSNCKRKLIKSLDKSYENIIKGYNYIDKETKNKMEVVPAAEWILDNLSLIEKEYKDIKQNMPESYYKNLIVISSGLMKGYPRIYGIAVELVSHTDGRIDEDTIESFITAYQKNTVLTSGELWALPIMIRIALIQNISKVIEKIIYAEEEKQRGDNTANRMISSIQDGNINAVITKFNEEKILFTSHFTERLLKVLRDNAIENTDIFKWIDEKLEAEQNNTEKMINSEHHKQAGFQLSMGNSITSIREIESLNWSDCFERLSYLEQILKTDPADIYYHMDFESRDYYRHKIEKLSKALDIAETFIAKKAIECAEESCSDEDSSYKKHVGYYLLDDGINEIKNKLGYKNKGINAIKNKIVKNKVSLYIGTIITFTILIMAIILGISMVNDKNIVWWKYALAALAIFIPSSEIVISTFNWSMNRLNKPCFIPKMEYKNAIPKDYSTMVIIPTLLGNVNKIHDLTNDMEVYYLANRETNIYFALLGDFKDSENENEDLDREIIKTALQDIENLNKKYCNNGEDIFYFFNRYRKYNEKEKIWLGWERKRGKIMEFNALLRGDKHTSYNVISGDISILHNIKYVITLDADTKLPRDSAKKLIGAMTHPLNKPHYNNSKKKILRGHGLMQPRVSVSIASANKTLFSKIFSGETGIDLYTTAVSDTYQDLFDEGIFTGKGIYDVDAFNFILKDEIPENSVLSHDLLEGCYVRAALITDVELIDGYPAYYNSSSIRLHRWVRGDWQLLPWITKKSSLNALSKWKIIDNLRRSLVAPSMIFLILLSLSILPGEGRWLIVAFISLLCPILFDVSDVVVMPMKGISLSGRIQNGKTLIEQILLIFCFLPYQSYLMADAVIRTLYRLIISKKNMLEWLTAEDAELKLGKKLNNFIHAMWPGSGISILIFILCLTNLKNAGFFMIPSCILWFLSPYIAYYISQERKKSDFKFNDKQINLLRNISRKTWAYFEDFVCESNNWLAPDNFQEDPAKGIAPRTSPTNMGMGLTSTIAARDLGYLGLLESLDRVEKILANMEELPMYKGHFYNWYNTKTKEPLHPKYVSTVDSGNLAGYFWVTSEAIKDYIKHPFIISEQILGIRDNLILSNEEIEKINGEKNYYSNIITSLSSNDINFDIIAWKKILSDIYNKAIQLQNFKNYESYYWNIKLKKSVNENLKEIEKVFPWINMDKGVPDKMSYLSDKLRKLASSVPIEKLIIGTEEILKELNSIVSLNNENTQNKEWINQVISSIKKGNNEITNIVDKITNISKKLKDFVTETDFTVVYDKKRKIFSIGYDVENDSIGNCYYDLLASEARQASFIAIAKGDIEQEHWFQLSRTIGIIGKNKGLVSWSGTMFEYLMPLLIMKSYPDTLLSETYLAVVEGQKRYGMQRGVPWGISESAFYNLDINMNYQYKAFGVPGIGLRRGLLNDLVVSPYSTIMALQVDPLGAVNNLYKLKNEGLEAKYGFYEAIDYTKERLPKGKKKLIVKNFMVHHEGMSLMALDNVLNNNIFQERFHKIPDVKATELLLQEKVSKTIIYDRDQKIETADLVTEKEDIVARKYSTALTEIPETHLLSNGEYSLMITNGGSGYSKINDVMLYRWKEDVTLDSGGMYIFIKNLNSNEYWSTTFQPCKYEGENYEVTFLLDKAEFKRKDGNISTYTEIAVSSEDNTEVRRVSITNHSEHSRIIEVTSYCEVTLAQYSADLVHPAFSNLFIKTEYLESIGCIVANRRARAKNQKSPYVMQVMAIEGETAGALSYETSRVNFIGRGRDISNPSAMENETPLNNTAGAVLDPIISMRRRVKIRPGETCKIAFALAVADSAQEAENIARKYREMQNINRVFELSWTQSQVEMKYLGIKSNQANLYQIMASKILFISPMLKDRSQYIKNIKNYQKDLWCYGISGDIPIVLLIVRQEKDKDLVRQVLNAHEYWSIKGLKVDLVIVNLEETNYLEQLNGAIRDIISSSHARDKQNKQGGVFHYNKSTMSSDVIELLISISRIVIDSNNKGISSQIKNSRILKYKDNVLQSPVKEKKYDILEVEKSYDKKLEYFNEFGGFDLEENRYVIILKSYNNTPAPWINVISNGNFGFHVSESGSAYTWYKNSRENKITTWHNDWITDSVSEGLYIKDEDTKEFWSLSPKPVRDDGEYVIEHGFGYSNFSHSAHGIIGKMTMFVPMDENVKICIISLKNNTTSQRKLSVSYYAELVLGVAPQQTAQYISTYLNEEKKYIYGQNPYSEHFGKMYAYLKIINGNEEKFTGNRSEFIGRDGLLSNPSSMRKDSLSDEVGSGLDPCLAAEAKINLNSGEEKNIIILLGEDESIEEINNIISKYENAENSFVELDNTKKYWQELLGIIKVKTPDETMNLIMNGWLIYQTISCRYWARTAFYQSGGAYGFRDQLQDVMAMSILKPELTKKQIIYSASRQYLEGDVQHWWHPGVNSGIRTRFSDDLLWLPYVVIDYIQNTGDYSVLDEKANYLKDEPLKEGEDERYNIVLPANVEGSIYEHCIKAIDLSLRFGKHNIPLMGSGDWNDGMSTVGNEGKGESVWLGWFLFSILNDFKSICKYKNDEERFIKYDEMQNFIKDNLEENAWDGGWYRRAYFDNGMPLGSSENDECQIDSISQSWAVISGAAKESRAREAINALENYLIKEDKGLVLLLTPPFNNSALEPGYIKGYVPGVRENGGQYTHAAIWVILAMAELGYGDKAVKIFNMINPVNHTNSRIECERYKAEPYVMSADVYAKEPHEGRAGWSWYTGSSGWMYRTGLQGILGFKLKEGKGFVVEPCIPSWWQGYKIEYTNKECKYYIEVKRSESKGVYVDGKEMIDGIVPNFEDGNHQVEVYI